MAVQIVMDSRIAHRRDLFARTFGKPVLHNEVDYRDWCFIRSLFAPFFGQPAFRDEQIAGANHQASIARIEVENFPAHEPARDFRSRPVAYLVKRSQGWTRNANF